MAKRFPMQPVNELTPVFRNIYFKNITIDNCENFIYGIGLPESPIENIYFENIQSKNKDIFLQDVSKMTFI